MLIEQITSSLYKFTTEDSFGRLSRPVVVNARDIMGVSSEEESNRQLTLTYDDDQTFTKTIFVTHFYGILRNHEKPFLFGSLHSKDLRYVYEEGNEMPVESYLDDPDNEEYKSRAEDILAELEEIMMKHKIGLNDE